MVEFVQIRHKDGLKQPSIF